MNIAVKPVAVESAESLLPGIKVIDVDTHISEWPDLWTSRAPASLKHRMPRIVGEGEARRWVIDEDTMVYKGVASSVLKDGSKSVGAYTYQRNDHSTIHAACYDPKGRVALMDEMGVYAQIAYPNVLGFSGQRAMKVPEDLRIASMQIYNDAMAEMQRESGERVFPMAMLPWWNLKECVAEAERCAQLGFRGFNFNPDPHEHGLPSIADPFWTPLWELLSERKLPLNFHVGSSDESMTWTSLAGLPEFGDHEKLALGGTFLPLSNMRVLANILMSRFLENWPDLKIVSVESGVGWVPFLLESIEYLSAEAGKPFETSPWDIFHRQIYVCAYLERRNIVSNIRNIGVDNVMFQTDFPHPACIYPAGVGHFAEAITQMTPEESLKFFSGNAARVYNIAVN